MTHTGKKGEQYPVKGRRFIVYGMARSGIAASRVLLERGGRVVGVDDAAGFSGHTKEHVERLAGNGMRLVLKPTQEEMRGLVHDSDALVLSPGVALSHELVDACESGGVECFGELELGARLCPCRLIAVSGSNGKTTTVCLIYEFLKARGFTAHLVGNVGSSYTREDASGYFINGVKILFTDGIGVPFCERLNEIQPDDWVVAEASSYQLESTIDFHPHIVVLLNIVEDHLARHGSMAGYIAAKSRLFANQESGDWAILNADNADVNKAFAMSGVCPETRYFSLEDKSSDAYFQDGVVFQKIDNQAALLLKRHEYAPPGDHNIENLMAASLAASAAGVGMDFIRNAARMFRGVEHRIEWVGEFNGVKVYNDSKGTNPDSTINALKAFDTPVILVLGGYEKGSDFSPLFEFMPGRVKHTLIIGATAGRIDTEMESRGMNNRVVVNDIEGALKWAKDNAGAKDILLLSPASASFDQFTSYEERGRVFKKLAGKILGEGADD